MSNISSTSTVPFLPMSPTGSSSTSDGSVTSPTDQKPPSGLRYQLTNNKQSERGSTSVRIATRPIWFDDSLSNKIHRRHSVTDGNRQGNEVPHGIRIAEEELFLLDKPYQQQRPLSATLSSPRQECILPISQLPVEQPNRPRLVSKDGNVNVEIGDASKAKELSVGFFDLYTTFVELKWTHIIMLICTSLIFSWAFFALGWYVIITYRGDLGYRSRPPVINNETGREEPYKPCVIEVDSYVTAFLYTLEAQTTIGFGSRNPTDRCPESVFLLVLQTVAAVCQAATIGAVMAGKFIKPSRRKQALKLSKYACVESATFALGSQLVLRMYDLRRKSRIIVQNVYGVLVRRSINPKTGTPTLASCEVPFKASYGMGSGNILLTVFPVTLVHEIDESSPFFGMKETDLVEGAFELIVAVDGLMELNGLAFRKLSSYLPDEIKLGYGFEDFYGSLTGGRLSVNYNKLESIRLMPLQNSKSI